MICTGPDTPIGADSELWITLSVAKTAMAGTYPVTVMISTTSPEGATANNTATAQLTIATTTPSDNGNDGGGDGNGGDGSDGNGTDGRPLPKTGQDLTGLLLLSVLLVIGGVAARIAARNRKTNADQAHPSPPPLHVESSPWSVAGRGLGPAAPSGRPLRIGKQSGRSTDARASWRAVGA